MIFRNLIQFDFHLRLADFFYDFFDEFNDLLDFFMCEHDRVEDSPSSGTSLCTCFYHHDRFLRSGNHQMHIVLASLCSKARVHDELSIHSFR